MSFNEPLDEKEVIPENTQQKKRCITIIIIASLILFIAIIAVSITLFFITRKDDIKGEIDSTFIRLKSWEFGSSSEITLSGEDISKGINSESFHKAPEDFYVCTPMGGLSGHEDKFFYERELEKVDPKTI